MLDETVTLRRIIADCVQSELRYLDNPPEVDLHWFGDRVAQGVMDRLRSAGFEVHGDRDRELREPQ